MGVLVCGDGHLHPLRLAWWTKAPPHAPSAPQKASQMIRDLMKGFATDKCIMLMMAVIVCLIVTLIILKYTSEPAGGHAPAGVSMSGKLRIKQTHLPVSAEVLGKKSVNIPTIGPTPAPATPAATPKARKLLTSPLLMESYFA